MANDFEVGVDVGVPPAAAWALAGDPVRIREWFAPVSEVVVEDDLRTVTMANGAVLRERLVDRDDAARRYSYQVESGIPGLLRHRATIAVDEAPGGARVRWRQTAESEVEGYDIEARLSAAMRAALESLRERLEGAATA